MTPEELGFRQSICAAPGDDLPRLVYADWLDEKAADEHDPRCQLAKMIRGQLDPAGPQRLTSTLPGLWDLSNSLDASIAVAEGDAVYWHFGSPEAGSSLLLKRGFLWAIRCTAADWLAHHESLFWHPDQRVACEACHGAGGRDVDQTAGGSHHFRCRTCRGTARVPRAFPPTAQPIERVTLTALVPGAGLLLGRHLLYQPDDRGGENVWRCDRWPGVTFELPPAADDAAFQQVVQQFGLPPHLIGDPHP